jgi:hypothetical protein
MQKMKEKEEKESKAEVTAHKKASDGTTSKQNTGTQSGSTEAKVEAAEADMEPLF